MTSLDFGLNSDCNTSLTTWIGFDIHGDGIPLCRHEDSPNLMVFRDGSSSVMRAQFISSPVQAAYPGFRLEYDTEFTGMFSNMLYIPLLCEAAAPTEIIFSFQMPNFRKCFCISVDQSELPILGTSENLFAYLHCVFNF